jgi:hypothetical protein
MKKLARLFSGIIGFVQDVTRSTSIHKCFCTASGGGEETVLMRLPHYTNKEHHKTIVHVHIDGFEGSARMEYFDESPKAWIASSITYLDHRFRDILWLV